MNEFAGVTVRGKRRQINRSFRAFFDRDFAVLVHIRDDRTGMRGINFDRRVFQFVGEMNRVAVERGFRDVVSWNFPIVNRRIRVAVQCERTQPAR